ncbi:MAG: CDP-alcohol phosphatidyltransferase family protein [Desulfurococcales archaeon]|nr:CDP-alcohol phosphatidyltransferase family protein [Desulfurococcales archaeon]
MRIGLATIVSLAGLALASASIPVSLYGLHEYALRLLFLAYLADVLDGWVARRRGEASELGFMLDRAIDRVSQIIAPLTLYASWIRGRAPEEYYILFTIYFSIIVSTGFYRLIYRRVTTLEYFHGLPMFFHAGILITSMVSGRVIPIYILYLGAVMSIAPIRYYRRGRSGGPSPGVAPRAVLLLLLALIPYDNRLVTGVSTLIYYSLIAYLLAGPLLYKTATRPAQPQSG